MCVVWWGEPPSNTGYRGGGECMARGVGHPFECMRRSPLSFLVMCLHSVYQK